MKTDERNKTANVAHLQKIRHVFRRARAQATNSLCIAAYLPLPLPFPSYSLSLLYNIISIHR